MKRLLLLLTALAPFYLVGYIAYRQTHIEVWEKDKSSYVIFPRDGAAIYYLFRPLTYLDGAITGMRFHIGPHAP